MRHFLRSTSSTLLVLLLLSSASAQQIPFLVDIFGRYDQFNRLYTARKKAGGDVTAFEALRKRGEAAFRSGNLGGILETLGEGLVLVQGRKWDERERFLASLVLEPDRLVVEPNQEVQISVTRAYQAPIEKAFPAAQPTISLEIISATPGAKSATAPRPIVMAQGLAVAEAATSASRKLLLADGSYWVVARIYLEGKQIGELKRSLFAIGDFSLQVAELSRRIAAIKASTDPRVKAVAVHVSTPEFQLLRLSQLNRSRGDVELDAVRELDRIENGVNALAVGSNPFAAERGEVERAYPGSDGKLIPYRLYVPNNYDGKAPRPLVVMLHGALGDESYYFSGLFDPALVKGEAERRGVILAGVNGRGRISGYRGLAQEDPIEVIRCVTRDYRVDEARVYLTGHSMGAAGAWSVAGARPELFAAIAPVSGGGPPQADARAAILQKVNSLPVLIVHGAKDGIVPPDRSRELFGDAQKMGMNVKYLELPDADHISVLAETFAAVLDFFEKNPKTVAPAR